MPVPYKTPLALLTAVLATAASAQATLTGLLTLKEGAAPVVQVGEKPACLELPMPPKNLSFEGDGVPILEMKERTLCVRGAPELWGKEVLLGLDQRTSRYALKLRFDPNAPDTLIRVRSEAPAFQRASDKQEGSAKATSAESAPTKAAQKEEGLSSALVETLKNLTALLNALVNKSEVAPTAPPSAPVPPKPEVKPPVAVETASTETSKPTLPPPPSGSEVLEAKRAEEAKPAKPQTEPLLASVSVRNGKLFVSFTLINTEDYPYVLKPEGIEAEFEGKPVQGEATLRFASGINGWIPPKSSAIGSLLLDMPARPGSLRLKVKAVSLDPNLSEKTWMKEWAIKFMPVVE